MRFSFSNRSFFLFCLLWIFLLVFPIKNAPALLLDTHSYGETTLLDIDSDFKESPEIALLSLMKTKLQKGDLLNAGALASVLVEKGSTKIEVNAIHALYLVAEGDLEKARMSLKNAHKRSKDNFYVLCAQAMIKFREKKIVEAQNYCSKAIEKDPTHPYSRNILGRVYNDLKQFKNAHTEFKKAIDLVPEFLPGYINLGATSYNMENYQESANYFQKALEINNRSYQALYGSAIAYQTMGQSEEALKAYLQCHEINPANADVLKEIANLQILTRKYNSARTTGLKMQELGIDGANFILASSALHLGNTEQAIVLLNKVQNLDIKTQNLLGICYIVSGQYDKGLEVMQGILKENILDFSSYVTQTTLLFYLEKDINPAVHITNRWDSNAELFLNIISACFYASKDKWEKAYNDLIQSERLINGFSMDGLSKQDMENNLNKQEMRYIALGILYYFRNLDDSAIKEFDNALKVNPESFLAHHLIGQVYLRTGERNKAEKSFENSLAKTPNFFSSLYILGELKFTKGDLDTAFTYYKKALSVKKDPGLMIKLGMFYENTGKYENAAQLYKDVIKSLPDNFVGYNQLAWLYAKRGVNLDEAMALTQKANKLQPGNMSILDTMGWILYHQGKYPQAIKYLEKAKQVNKKDPMILYHLAAAYKKIGKNDLSSDFARRAIDISDKFEGADEAKKLLQ